jgi:hypothetical protein
MAANQIDTDVRSIITKCTSNFTAPLPVSIDSKLETSIRQNLLLADYNRYPVAAIGVATVFAKIYIDGFIYGRQNP